MWSLITHTGRTLNMDWSMTPGYLKSTKVRSHSKRVEVQIEHYKDSEGRSPTPPPIYKPLSS